MSEAPVPASPPRRRRKLRWLVIVAVLIAVPILGLVGFYFVSRYQGQRALDEAIAEADRLDPGWRLEDIEKLRTAVPPEQNAAVHINAAMTLVSGSFLAPKDEEALFNILEVTPQCQIDSELTAKLRKGLDPLLPAVEDVRKAVPLKAGWYPIKWTPAFFDTMMPHVQDVRQVGHFLRCLAILQSQDGKHDDAWQTSLAIIAVARSIGAEPSLIASLVQVALRAMMVGSLERCLAQGQVADPLLAAAQKQLAEEAARPVLLPGLRGERAGLHMMMSNAEAGKIQLDKMFGKSGGGESLLFRLRGVTGMLKHDHAWMLRYHNEAVDNAKLPPAEIRAKMRLLEQKIADGPLLAKMFVSALPRIGEAEVRSRVFLECAITGIAVERYRLQHGNWPDSLADVVAARLLDKVPTDYFADKPLGYRKASDGVVVYSVYSLGKMGEYKGDALDEGKRFDNSIIRVEFRLWNVTNRGQSPRPKADDPETLEQDLKKAIAETNRLDEGWKLDQIEMRRKAIPAAENAALVILAAAELLPKSWPNDERISKLGDEHAEPPQFQLEPKLVETLRKEIQLHLPAAALARKALPLKLGAYPVRWAPDFISTDFTFYLLKVRRLAEYLQYLAMLQSQDGKADDACQTALTLLAITRSVGEEPCLMSQVFRNSLRSLALSSLERCLAQGQVSGPLLAEVQQRLAEEAAEPIFYYGVRGERAGLHHYFTWSAQEKALEHAWDLRFLNDAMKASMLPPSEQLKEFKELEDRKARAPELVRDLVDNTALLAKGTVRTGIQLECALAAVAAERYRHQHGRWPGALDELVSAKLLDKVPIDPYSGNDLRFRRTSDGFVIYSVGPDGNYAGDALDAGRAVDPDATRLEFRLWDEKARRQPAQGEAEKK
jgi:hypothetical protein